MQYYSLHYGVKKIGRAGSPQVGDIEMKPGKKVTDDDFAWKLYGDRFPDFEPYLGTLVLRKGAAVTDFISSAIISRGFVCSGRVREIIQQHKVRNIRYYDLGIRHREILFTDYKLLHCVNNYVDRIDYTKSIFQKVRVENNTWIGERCEIDSLAEYRELALELSKNSHGDWVKLEPVQVKFLGDYQPEHDIFIIWGITYKTYISERLRSAFEKNKITGVTYDFDDRHTDFG